MNKTNLIFFVLAVFIGFSCRKNGDLLDINFKISKTDSFTVPKSAIGIPVPVQGVSVLLPPASYNTNEDFEKNGTRANLIKDANLDQFTLTIPETSSEDFGFLKSIEIRVSSPSHSTPEVLAYLNDIPANAGKTLELISPKTSLAKYIRDSGFTLQTQVTVDEPINSEIPVKSTMTFNVTANPLKN